MDRGSEIVAVAHASVAAVNNGRAGVRYESSPLRGNGLHPRQPTALVELVGVDGYGAQNATVRGNAFGPTTIAGTEYPHNGSGP